MPSYLNRAKSIFRDLKDAFVTPTGYDAAMTNTGNGNAPYKAPPKPSPTQRATTPLATPTPSQGGTGATAPIPPNYKPDVDPATKAADDPEDPKNLRALGAKRNF
jgi:hypothetical protein